jgi:hypothetical protein
MATLLNKGLELQAKLTNGVSTDPFTDMALGSGTTAEAVDQTALVTELTLNGLARAAATCSYEDNYKAKWVGEFTATADSQVVNEMGIFNTGNDIFMRHKYASTKNLDDGETLTITVILTESRTT